MHYMKEVIKMKRYQEIEIEKYCKSRKTFLKSLQKKHPKFFEEWGECIIYNFKHGIEKCGDCEEEGFILWTYEDECFSDDDKLHFYICFIATSKEQVIIEN